MGQVIIVVMALAFSTSHCSRHDDGAGDLWRIPKYVDQNR